MLQKRGQPGVLIHWALHGQETATQLVDQADAHHVAARVEKRYPLHRLPYLPFQVNLTKQKLRSSQKKTTHV